MRRRMMMQQRSELPSGYTRCKYLESSGKQWIDTAHIPSSVTLVNAIIMYANNQFGVFYGTFYTHNAGVKRYAVNLRFDSIYFYYGSYSRNSHTISDAVFDKMNENKITISQKGIELNGVLLKENIDPGESFSCGYRALLFSCNSESFGGGGSIARISRVEVFDSGILTRCFISSLDPSDKPCMFDTVTRQPFYNKGTGEFGYELMDGTYVAPI